MKALADEFQRVRQTGAPIGPVVRAVAHAIFVGNPSLFEGDVQQSIPFGEKIIVAAIDVPTNAL